MTQALLVAAVILSMSSLAPAAPAPASDAAVCAFYCLAVGVPYPCIPETGLPNPCRDVHLGCFAVFPVAGYAIGVYFCA